MSLKLSLNGNGTMREGDMASTGMFFPIESVPFSIASWVVADRPYSSNADAVASGRGFTDFL